MAGKERERMKGGDATKPVGRRKERVGHKTYGRRTERTLEKFSAIFRFLFLSPLLFLLLFFLFLFLLLLGF